MSKLILIALLYLAWSLYRDAGTRQQLLYLLGMSRLDNRYLTPIMQYNHFYQRLPETSKRIFRQRVIRFLLVKTFIPRQMPRVTDEMKALIAAAAVQLTFGLPHVLLQHFDKIIVYPDTYYSLINRQYHKGEVNPRFGAIVLSWKAFVSGFSDHHDGINLGLHEMAHALKLENIIRNDEQGFFDPEEYAKWGRLAGEEMARIREGQSKLFRDYAARDYDEFFANCIEVYFEQPHQLLEYNPELYKTLSNLLRQDTVRLFDKPLS